MYFLGLDGGGSVTACCVIDENKNEVMSFKGESVNFRFEGLEKARKSLEDILKAVEDKLGENCLSGVFIGCSALWGQATAEETNALCDGIFTCPVHMDSDVFLALKACSVDNALAVIAGTGSMAAAFDSEGQAVTKGGFGALLGDEGSGYRIAEAALRTAVMSSQDAVPYTQLEDEAYGFFGVETMEELTDKTCSGELSRKEIAAFAKEVCACAEAGDEAANSIIREQTGLLSCTVKALAESLEATPNIFVYGGMFKNEIYRSFFMKHMGIDRLYNPVHSPQFAAALLALEYGKQRG